MSNVVRYRPLDDLGEVRLDLDECPRRFVLFEQDPDHPDYPLEGPLEIAIYLTPDGRWVQYTEELSDYISRPNVVKLLEVTPAYVIQELGLSMRELPPDLAALEPYREAMRQSQVWGYMPRAGIEPAPLSEAPNGPAAPRLKEEKKPPDAPTQRPVILGKPGDEPIVLGKRKNRLTQPRYDVITALLAAGDDGLSKDSLATDSGHGDAVGILKRLADSDPEWKAVIRLAGVPGGRYRISG